MIERRYSLSEKWEAVLILEPKGQIHPAAGDEIRVVARLHLPATKDANLNMKLVEQLQYGDRVKIGWEGLHESWGRTDIGRSTRYEQESIAADTYQEAYRHLEQWAVNALRPLMEAIAARRVARLAAGSDDGADMEPIVLAPGKVLQLLKLVEGGETT